MTADRGQSAAMRAALAVLALVVVVALGYVLSLPGRTVTAQDCTLRASDVAHYVPCEDP